MKIYIVTIEILIPGGGGSGGVEGLWYLMPLSKIFQLLGVLGENHRSATSH
jgi:hypothetical protein